MQIQVKQKSRFILGNQQFTTQEPGVVHEAPDWIVNDPHFWALLEHGENAEQYLYVSGQPQTHPMGKEPLLKVYGNLPEKPAHIPAISRSMQADALSMIPAITVVENTNQPVSDGKKA